MNSNPEAHSSDSDSHENPEGLKLSYGNRWKYKNKKSNN